MAGTARIALRNEGSATWRGVRAAYHWLDDRGNPIVWDGWRTDLPRAFAPGEEVELDLAFRAPRPPGAYRLAFDLVDEERGWFEEFGNAPCELPVEVRPRIDERRLTVRVLPGEGSAERTRAALLAQEEPAVDTEAVAVAYLVTGCLPSPDWSRRILDAHAEGFAAVGGSVELVGGRRREAREWQPWSRAGGRNPSFREPLLFPSLLAGLEPGEHHGLPAWAPDPDLPDDLVEPWLYDGRIELRLERSA